MGGGALWNPRGGGVGGVGVVLEGRSPPPPEGLMAAVVVVLLRGGRQCQSGCGGGGQAGNVLGGVQKSPTPPGGKFPPSRGLRVLQE